MHESGFSWHGGLVYYVGSQSYYSITNCVPDSNTRIPLLWAQICTYLMILFYEQPTCQIKLPVGSYTICSTF